ncbi:AAA family ATPase [Leifsonia sp. NPDC102414]|uniref:AAA family ATPase n=1 Tax=Leifsonia sp. NPDC102414 TaxID=3364124 RepID=UPI003818496D
MHAGTNGVRYAFRMRGGMARWKRGVASQGVKQALDYALAGTCDASQSGAIAASGYADDAVLRHIVEDGMIRRDVLDRDKLEAWISGRDPETGVLRGREVGGPSADLLLDATINASKSFSIAAMIDADIHMAYEDLMDRLRDRTILAWQRELNARRGHAGAIREDLSRIEVVELNHERSRALDPHKHRHLWLNIKVQGQDGRWTNIDSRVAMKFQTVINAEGDLAARTDPQWLAALAAKGYTLNADGEIEQLAHLVRPLSRRSNQIEANRTVKLTEWRTGHPGQEPTAKDLQAIDQWAYAHGRPNKPGQIDEADWAATVHAELTAIDPTVGHVRAAVTVRSTPVAGLDRAVLAATGVADADARATGTGGRYSMFDVQAGVRRAVAASGVVADRAVLEELIDDVTGRAVAGRSVNLLTADGAIPAHVKAFMSQATVALKADVARQYAALATPGQAVDAELVDVAQTDVLEDGLRLDTAQTQAAAAVAGTDSVVTITGPAGTGKTTMLKVAKKLLDDQGRGCIIVAPTKKAANVAGRETSTTSSSVHALLRDHGWYWGEDVAGRTVWQQVTPGEQSPLSNQPYNGVSRYPLHPGDRIVVDEAGMLGLHEARALALLAQQTGAQIALIGDHLQVSPVGHSGAMLIARTSATARIELETVQRFRKLDAAGNPLLDGQGNPVRDDEYAELTKKLREPASEEEARQVAAALISGGHVVTVTDQAAVLHYMVDRHRELTQSGKTLSLVVSTNEEAQTINEAIQAGRLTRGELDTSRIAFAQNGQPVYAGETVQTRRNDTDTGVNNRDLWTVEAIQSDGTVRLASMATSGLTRTVSSEYFADHAHLAYASTVHGEQGETNWASITGPGVDAAGLYVGATRGKFENTYVSTAGTPAKLVDELVETMHRGRAELTVDDSRAAARAELERAARPSPSIERTTPAWDSSERPFGHVLDITTETITIDQSLASNRERTSWLQDTITINEKRLQTLRTSDANEHHKERINPVTTSAIASLDQRVTATRAELATLAAERRTHERTIELLQQEERFRGRLTAAQLAAEEQARTERINQVRAGKAATAAATGPVSRPSPRRGGPARR